MYCQAKALQLARRAPVGWTSMMLDLDQRPPSDSVLMILMLRFKGPPLNPIEQMTMHPSICQLEATI